MRLRWAGRWLEAPCYARTEGGVVIEAHEHEAVARVADRTGGRVLEASMRKVGVFVLIEGPTRTFHKVRAKLEQRRYLGSWHVTLVQGRRCSDRRWVLGLAPCAPPEASHFLVPEELVRELSPPLATAAFEAVARCLRADSEELERLGHERYLYSGNPVPAALARRLDDAFGSVVGPPPSIPAPHPPRFQRQRRIPSAEATLHRMQRDAIQRRPTMRPLALLGGGDYARIEIMPAFERSGRLAPHVVADREPQIAIAAARRCGFPLATTDPFEAIDVLPARGVVMVATAHDSHARLGAHAARRGHAVFIEKPAVVTREDLELLVSAGRSAPGAIEIGFNRRHAPLLAAARSCLERADGPTTVTCTIREVPMADTHWFLWPNQGTRVAGNLCHWLDLGVHLVANRGDPVEVRVSPPLASDRAMPTAEERSISVGFSDGSLLTVLGTVRGDDTRGGQETVEVRRGQTTVTIDDFRTLTVLEGGRRRVIRRVKRDKGHTEMYARWAAGLGSPTARAEYPLRDLLSVCLLQLAATELIRSGGAHCRTLEEIHEWRRRTTESAGARSMSVL